MQMRSASNKSKGVSARVELRLVLGERYTDKTSTEADFNLTVTLHLVRLRLCHFHGVTADDSSFDKGKDGTVA